MVPGSGGLRMVLGSGGLRMVLGSESPWWYRAVVVLGGTRQ